MKLFFLWLSLICIIIFILQILIPSFTDLFILNQKALTDYQYYRFLTAIFLHGDITHLMLNLFALLFFGIVLEKKIGPSKFLATFLLSGIIANIVSVNFYESSLGASGAIYGMIGTLTILAPMIMVWAFGLMMPLFLASILWVVADVLRTLGAFGETNIGTIAHLSGIIIGLLIGVYLRLNMLKMRKKRDVKIRFDEKELNKWEDKFVR